MTLDQFITACDFNSLVEMDKVCHLAFFYLKTKNVQEFSVAEASKWLVDSGGATPNRSRLEGKLRSSRDTAKAQYGFRLKGEFIKELEGKYPEVSPRSQEVIDDGTILPEIDYKNTRGYIVSLAKQINASYEHNIYDGCAVLMRRLEEVLLIHSYEKHGIAAVVKDGNGNYLPLEGIVKDAVGNTALSLSRNSKATVEDIRKLGNFSAHKITYTCKREYISEKIPEFRALIGELLHKAGIRT